jgi:formylglycine-generating enzyme required for sulfatase activity
MEVTMAVLEATRAQLAAELTEARRQSEILFSVLRPSYLYERPISERHRVIFYIGHLDAFDYIQICREGLGRQSSEPALDALFQAGIDPDSENLPADLPSDWPSLERTTSYVRQARRAVDHALDDAPVDSVYMALEHRLMHLETLAYMWHNFGHEAKIAPAGYDAILPSRTTPANSWRKVPAGEVTLGKPRDGSFGWDNEYNEHVLDVPAFSIQKYKITNGDYLRFVRDGASLPHFWTEREGRLYYRGMFEEIPLPLDWPVYVTQREAASYAAWAGKALPTEQQFQRAAYGADGRLYPWGNSAPAGDAGNFDFKRWDPESVSETPCGKSAYGVHQLVGNGWEWTSTVFAPFDGFQAAPSYPGYSANFFDGQHYVIKGGSPRTAARLLRRSFRNWFRPEYPYVYGAFRCVES